MRTPCQKFLDTPLFSGTNLWIGFTRPSVHANTTYWVSLSSNPENPLGYPGIFLNRNFFVKNFTKSKLLNNQISQKFRCEWLKTSSRNFLGQIEIFLIVSVFFYNETFRDFEHYTYNIRLFTLEVSTLGFVSDTDEFMAALGLFKLPNNVIQTIIRQVTSQYIVTGTMALEPIAL